MKKVAYVDEQGYVTAIGYVGDDIVVDEYIIPIEDDFDILNKLWNGTAWEEYTPPEPPAPEPTQLDRIEANTNAIMEKESSLDILLGVSE